jgi:uncharacterized membrane protein YeaQ/YmgE (transglycosylase-associated protein family)
VARLFNVLRAPLSLLIILLIGIITGFAGGFFLTRDTNLAFVNVFIGLAGSLAGLGIYFLLHLGSTSETSLIDVKAILCSLTGAILSVLLFDLVQAGTAGEINADASHEEDDDS